MIGKKRMLLIVLIAVLQIGLVLTIVIFSQNTMKNGKLVFIEIDPNNPVELSADNSLIINYKGMDIFADSLKSMQQLTCGQKIYIEMNEQGRYVTAAGYDEVSPDAVYSKLWIYVTVSGTEKKITPEKQTAQSSNEASAQNIEYRIYYDTPIKRLVVTQDEAKSIYNMIANGAGKPIYAAVKILNGRAAIEDIYVGDTTLSSYLGEK